MYNLEVIFTKQLDNESKAIEIYNNDILIAHGKLNLCSNMAHVQLLEKYRKAFKCFDIECQIEERNISHNRILI